MPKRFARSFWMLCISRERTDPEILKALSAGDEACYIHAMTWDAKTATAVLLLDLGEQGWKTRAVCSGSAIANWENYVSSREGDGE